MIKRKINKKVTWFIGVAQNALVHLSDVNMKDFFLDKEVCRYVNDVGRKRIREIFGDKVTLSIPSLPQFYYGHMVALGAKPIFVDKGDPFIEPLFSNVREGIKWLKKDIDFTKNDLFKHYYEIYLYLKDSFPDEHVIFNSYNFEGPVTTAVLLRGQDFYMDLYDEPELAREYIRLVTESIISFSQFLKKMNNQSLYDENSLRLADDLSSLLAPHMFPEFVVPFWNAYYERTTTGKRKMHVENLNVEHLKYLDEAKIDFYDPSVSPNISPKMIIENTKTGFTWRLLGIKIPYMTKEDIEKWVYDNIDEGANALHTIINFDYCQKGNTEKVRYFVDACDAVNKEYGFYDQGNDQEFMKGMYEHFIDWM